MTTFDDMQLEYYNGMYFQKISTHKPGYTFGELSLIQTDCRRNATVKCEQRCTFGVLDIVDYNKTLKIIEMRKMFKISNFIASVPWLCAENGTSIRAVL